MENSADLDNMDLDDFGDIDLGNIDLGDISIPMTAENIELIETIMSTFLESLDASTPSLPSLQNNPIRTPQGALHTGSHILMQNFDDESDNSTDDGSSEGEPSSDIPSTDEIREIFTDTRCSYIILTDRVSELGTSKLSADDIVMFDDLYNFRSGKYNKTRKMEAFKNRHKLIVVPENRIKYIHTILCGDLLVPKYIAFMSNPLGLVDSLTSSAKSNYLVTYKMVCFVSIIPSKIGIISTTQIQAMVNAYVIRIIINSVVRGATADDVVRTVLSEILAIRELTQTEVFTIEDMVSLVGCDCTAFLEDCVHIINRFGLFNGYITYQKFRSLLDVAEKLFRTKNQPIIWRPIILTMLVTNFDKDEITNFLWYVIRDSQLCHRTKYKYVILPDTMKMIVSGNRNIFVPTGVSLTKALHIIDCCSDIVTHRALIEIYEDIEDRNDLAKHGITIYPDRWNQVKHLFEPSIMMLYVSMFWVMANFNTAADASKYVSRIMFDQRRHTTQMRSIWRNLYTVYFSGFSNIIDISIMYIEKVVHNAVYEYDGTASVSTNINDIGAIYSVFKKDVVSQKQLDDMFCSITRGMEYYASLKSSITLFETYCRATDTKITEMDARETGGPGLGPSFDEFDIVPDCMSSTKPDVWLTWDMTKSLSLKAGTNLCCKGEADHHKLCKKKKCVSCNAERPKKFGYYRFLTCNSLIGMGEHLERLIITVKPSLHRVKPRILDRFVHSLAKTMNYHYTESNVQHTFDNSNIEYLIYIDMFYDMMTHSDSQFRFCKIFTNLNITTRTFEIDRSIDTTQVNGVINRNINRAYGLNFYGSNIRYIFSKLIDMFWAIRDEVIRLAAYYASTNDTDTGLVAYYTKHEILNKVIRQNDIVGMIIVLTNEIGNGITAIDPLFTANELKNSPVYKICKSNPAPFFN